MAYGNGNGTAPPPGGDVPLDLPSLLQSGSWGQEGLQQYIDRVRQGEETIPGLQQMAYDESVARGQEAFGRERQYLEDQERSALRRAAAAQGHAMAGALGGAGMGMGGGAVASARQTGRAFGETAADHAMAASQRMTDLETRRLAADEERERRRLTQQEDWFGTLQQGALGMSAAGAQLATQARKMETEAQARITAAQDKVASFFDAYDHWDGNDWPEWFTSLEQMIVATKNDPDVQAVYLQEWQRLVGIAGSDAPHILEAEGDKAATPGFQEALAAIQGGSAPIMDAATLAAIQRATAR